MDTKIEMSWSVLDVKYVDRPESVKVVVRYDSTEGSDLQVEINQLQYDPSDIKKAFVFSNGYALQRLDTIDATDFVLVNESVLEKICQVLRHVESLTANV